MATFHIGNRAYDLKSMSFVGLPPTELDGDVEPDASVTFTGTIKEPYADDLRDALTRHSFWATFNYGEYEFRVRDARLAKPLADRDHATLLLDVVFTVTRNCIIGLQRPRGQYPHNPDSSWNQAVYVWLQDRSHLRSKRAELEQYEAEIATKRDQLAAAETSLDVRKSRLIETSTPEQLHAATLRGF